MSHDNDDEFILFNTGAVGRLRNRTVFQKAITQFYFKVAATFGCSVSVSDRRIGEAHDFWLGDEQRTLHSATTDDTVELDHFKHAAFIAFWLRRLIPINDIYFLPDERVPSVAGYDNTAPSEAQIKFSRYGSEMCALLVGFYICLAYETYAMQKRVASSGAMVLSDAIGVRQLPGLFMSEYPKLLKHKGMSPHGMYMLYRSLFDTLDWNINVRASA